MNITIRIKDLSKQRVGRTTYGKLFASLLLLMVLVGSFAFIADEVNEGETLTRDTEILLRINNHQNSFLDTASLAVTYAGNILTVFLASVVIVAVLAKLRKWRSIVQVAFTMGGVIVLNATLKLLFQRERPALWHLITHESTYSFPSGHAMLTSALVTLVVLLCWNTKGRWAVISIGFTYTLLVGLSRLYLGVHYPTDVVAGWCVGTAWAIGVAMILGIVSIKARPLVKHP